MRRGARTRACRVSTLVLKDISKIECVEISLDTARTSALATERFMDYIR